MKTSGDMLIEEWDKAKSIIRKQWTKLEEEDLYRINGHFDSLICKLIEKYGYSCEEAKHLVKLYLTIDHIDL